MHNLAIALKIEGYRITGSDDEIFDPARSRLRAFDLLPENEGWFPEKIDETLDAVIVGMHARSNNPELCKAQELGIRIYSFPEFLYERSKLKKRVVIGGSHGKTTITAMVMHVLKHCDKDFDYLVGSQVKGFEVMVKISKTAPLMLFEGDEYLTAPFDPRPKFHLYHPHIALISGIAWDHINVFPDFDGYVEQFRIFSKQIQPGGVLIYNCEDELVIDIALKLHHDTRTIPYKIPVYSVKDYITYLQWKGDLIPLKIFGRHNLQNLAAAWEVCRECDVSDEDFVTAIASFEGAARRLEKVASGNGNNVFRDFAHAPSKLKATVEAMKENHPGSTLVACMELHTFSSLNRSFLSHYKHSMQTADVAIVYFNLHTIALKKLSPITKEEVCSAFEKENLQVFDNSAELFETLMAMEWENANLLLMSSGDFNGIDLCALYRRITGKHGAYANSVVASAGS